ncbi:hypothetical protein CYMTET_19841 [Cymbomonas tetramitiformis]|uniref:NADPH-protochlorophyllide oxidoreductase n=1 Tax=Cymbomonas tetramitiformis TaxID=36881 RepID=A0AAE0L4T9_9CHLO|nr:hypothetical protein CYMTET_19841 [Cymbomonas tetramitiformis]|eukprot:gene11680-13794_t
MAFSMKTTANARVQVKQQASRNGRIAAARPVAKHVSLSARRQVASGLNTNTLAKANVRASISSNRSPLVVSASIFSKKDKNRTVIITGASSGLGKATVAALNNAGGHHIVMAVRDAAKAEQVAQELGLPAKSYSILELQLDSFESVKTFVRKFKATGRQLDCLCCNAAVYLPNQPVPTFTPDGYEESVQVNHLSHFLLCRLLMADLAKSKNDPRMIIVGSITGNTNTVGGGAVAPFANLGDLKGLEAMIDGEQKSMMDGKEYWGAKCYKDSKLANMMTVLQLHDRYHEDTGITFSSMYPGCIAETALFRQKRGWFRWFFPIFMKFVTGGYVSQEEAGERLAQVVSSEDCSESGVYWAWNGGAKTVGWYDFSMGGVRGAGGAGGKVFKCNPSAECRDKVLGDKLWELSEEAVGMTGNGLFSKKGGSRKVMAGAGK